MMRQGYTVRGFRIAVFVDRNGEQCSIQESSSVTPSIWLGAGSNRMHLSQKMAKSLIPLLTHFVKHGVLPERPTSKRGGKTVSVSEAPSAKVCG